MSFIDYGAVVFKNGEQVNSGEFFMNMRDAVGWTDGKLDGNYFAFVGDWCVMVAFYKCTCAVYVDGRKDMEFLGMTDGKGPWYKDEKRMSRRYWLHWSPWSREAEIHIKKISDDVYHFSMTYRGDVYHVVYGYGIDCYKKTWDAVKVKYLGRKLSKRIDRLYKRLGGLK